MNTDPAANEKERYEPSGTTYDGFPFPSWEIIKFIENAGIATLLLKSGSIIHFTPENITNFKCWLYFHKIQDLKQTT